METLVSALLLLLMAALPPLLGYLILRRDLRQLRELRDSTDSFNDSSR